MCAATNNKEHGVMWSVLNHKCPRCRQGDLFTYSNPYNLKHNLDMPEHCTVCGQKYELQTGFYFGTGYVGYALTVFISAVTFVLWWFTIGMSVSDNRVMWWLGINAAVVLLLQPMLQRLSRAIWIAFFVRYEPDQQ